MTAEVGHDLRFGVLGPLEVTRDPGTGGRRVPVAVPGARQRAVLACLLVHVGRPVRPEVLVEAAWGEDLPGDPRAALHTVVSRLRSALGHETVASGPAGYTLRAGEGALDSERFEHLRAEAGAASGVRAAELLAEALALWRGPAHAEHADCAFAVAEAARLDGLRLDAVEERAAALLASSAPEAAVAELESLLTDQPFRERAVELLMTALYRSGRQAEALERFRDHRTLLADELGLDPAPDLVALESRILGHDLPPPSGGEEPHGWLDLSTSFVGRESWVSELVAAARSDRVVTVCGPGGVGKSRLVAEALPALVERVGGVAAVVELGAVRPGGVAVAVADALGLQDTGGAAVADRLAEYVGIAHRILVLDCCEHVREEVAALVAQLVRRVPRLGVVATSRHRLDVPAERVLRLGMLPAGSATGPAVVLFVDRVRRLRPGFDPDEAELRTVEQTCSVLDGLPLAIELAASRAATLGVGPVLDSLRAPAGTSTVPVVDLAEVVAWSARLLTEDQLRLFRRLSVFVGEFDLPAADAVGTGPEVGPAVGRPLDGGGDVAAALAELVESNLLLSRSDGDVMTYRMLTLVREAGLQLLDGAEETDAAYLAHQVWAGDVAAGAATDWLTEAAPEVAPRLARCTPDLLAAVRRALDADRPEVAARVTGPVQLCLHLEPGLEMGDLIVEVARRSAGAVEGPERALGLAAGAMALASRGENDDVRQLATAAHAASLEPVPRFLAAMALAVAAFYAGERDECAHWLGQTVEPGLEAGYAAEPPVTAALLACFAGDPATARRDVAWALTATRAAGAHAAHAFALYAAGEVEVIDDPERGAELFREAVSRAGEIGATHVAHVAALALYAVLVRHGHHDEATEMVGPVLAGLLRVGSWPQVWTVLRITAELLAARGRPHDATLVLAAVGAAPGAPPLVGSDPARYADLRARLVRELGAEVVRRIDAFAAGLRRTQVVDRARTVLSELAAREGL